MDQEILKVLFYDVRCTVVTHFSAWNGKIRTAIETITADMLQTVWNELDFRVDVCRITKGALYTVLSLYYIQYFLLSNYIFVNRICLACIVYDKLLKSQQSFRITLYFYWCFNKYVIVIQ